MTASKIIKTVLSIAMSALAAVLYLRRRDRLSRSNLAAMLVCSLGDFFMMDLFGIGGVSTYPGAGLFMLGHIIYGTGFLRTSKEKGYTFRNSGFRGGLALVTGSAVLLGILAFTIPQQPQTAMYFLILIYVAVIGYNIVCQFSYAASEKGKRWLTAAGMFLFLLSDFLIFLNMLDVMPARNGLVWATYVPAQVLVLIFGSGEKES